MTSKTFYFKVTVGLNAFWKYLLMNCVESHKSFFKNYKLDVYWQKRSRVFLYPKSGFHNILWAQMGAWLARLSAQVGDLQCPRWKPKTLLKGLGLVKKYWKIKCSFNNFTSVQMADCSCYEESISALIYIQTLFERQKWK